MIEVNLFEKKERNILPYFVLGVFVVGTVLLFSYLLFMMNYYSQADQHNLQIVQGQAEEVALSREIEQMDQLNEQNSEAISTLETQSYPINFITEDITSYIPREEEQVLLFDLNESNQVYIQLENIDVNESSEVIGDLESVPYIEHVNMTRLEQTNLEENMYQMDLTLDINDNRLREEALQ